MELVFGLRKFGTRLQVSQREFSVIQLFQRELSVTQLFQREFSAT